jgi:flagellar biosynthesis anti-sigma factor FlgM
MRITRRPSTTIPGLGEVTAAGDAAEPTAPAGNKPVTDRVELSEAALQRQRWTSEVRDGAVTSSERLQALQAAVADSTYAPSPRAVADKMLSDLAADLLA